MIKRIFAALLVAVMCLVAAGCANDGAPDGMYRLSPEGEPFILYVPDGWVSNLSSGVVSAYYSSTDNIAVSATYFTHENASITLSELVDEITVAYADSLVASLTARRATVLGGADAIELNYTATGNNRVFAYREIFVRHGDVFVALKFHCPDERYDELAEQFDKMVSAFVLADMGEVKNDCVTDKKTPEGMKIASNDKIEYRLYVPTTWVCWSEDSISDAYYPEAGKPNVSVTSYSPDNVMTAEEYAAMCETEYARTLEGYELISKEQSKVAGRDAVVMTYRVSYGDTQMRLMQTILVNNDLVYSITYTALDDRFDAHMDDVNAIVEAFAFR